jgi:hypothetical protein
VNVLEARITAQTLFAQWFQNKTKVHAEVIAGSISVLLEGRITGYRGSLIVQDGGNEINVDLLGATYLFVPNSAWTTEMIERFARYHVRGVQIVMSENGYCTVIERL